MSHKIEDTNLEKSSGTGFAVDLHGVVTMGGMTDGEVLGQGADLHGGSILSYPATLLDEWLSVRDPKDSVLGYAKHRVRREFPHPIAR